MQGDRRMVDRPNRARAARRASSRNRRKARNKRMIFLVSIVVIAFGIVIGSQIINKLGTLNDLKSQETQLKKQYKEQLEIAEDLKEKKSYVQTDEYVENMARKLGLLYPDEVILQPEK